MGGVVLSMGSGELNPFLRVCYFALLLLLGGLGSGLSAQAQMVDNSRKIEKITVRGLTKHSPRLVRSYLPVQEGDVFTQAAMQDVVKSLFTSNFFRHIKLYQNGGELIIDLVERPWIAKIVINGNELIEKDQIESILEAQNIVENRAFNREKFTQIIAEIESIYYLQGYYGVKIAVDKQPLDNNRVSLKVDIHEGDVTRIARINLIGNQAYQQNDLQRLFHIREDSPDYLFNQTDSYVRASLEGDLQRLSNFYQNRGYARFRLSDRQVSLLPDKSAVLINIHMEEGAIYKFADIGVSGYEKVLTTEQANELLLIKKGEIFSREKMVQSIDKLRQAIQNHGYAFVDINPIVRIQDESKQVFVNLRINIGRRIYVRRIIFSGNNVTLDDVIRVEMRQYEQALYIPQKVDLSKRRINRLGFFSQVDVSSVRVNDQQVDLIVRVNEKRTGSFNTRLGYSPQSGIVYQLTVAENNWLGRGHQAEIKLDLQQNSEAVQLGYTVPHFYEDGVSLSWNASYKRTRDILIRDDSFVLNQLVMSADLGFPASEDLRFNYGLGGAEDEVKCGSRFLVCQNFVRKKGEKLRIFNALFSSRWDLRNRGFFPSAGSLHTFSSRFILPGADISYYSLGLRSQFYGALGKSERSTVRLRMVADSIQGYSGGEVPFYKRLFVGGANTVRGYQASSLGPRYVKSVDGIDGFKGGELRSYVNLDFYIAVTAVDEFAQADDNFRLNLFLDSGYAFDKANDFSVDEFRSSVGVGWLYFSPLGIIKIYYGVPINHASDASVDQFGFLLGGAL